MTPILSEHAIIDLHAELIREFGGCLGVRDSGELSSAVAQPNMTFDGRDLYESPVQKAIVLGYHLILSHPILDGNKRIGFAALVVFLKLHDYNIEATVSEKEAIALGVAAGTLRRDELLTWVESHLVTRPKAPSHGES
jgi:death-on-curing protein